MSANYRDITLKGLWTNNPGLVQLLGLCPLLAVSTTVVNGLGLGLATMATLIASNAIVSAIRNWVRPEVRIPVFVMVIAAIVTAIELLMNAYLHELYRVLGIFIPLIVTNCSIIGRAEAFASKNTVPAAALDGFAQGLGFTLCLVVLGAAREVLGHGTLLADAQLLFGPIASHWEIVLIEDFRGLLLAILPPGAFLGLGLMIAGKNWIDRRQAQKVTAPMATPAAI
ncbi:MAG: electron transport complex subunit E [Oceanococcus sp.]